MRRPEFIARQACRPSGVIGRLLARVMAAETAPANLEAVRLLDVQPTDHVLEIGFGHGRTIERVTRLAPQGFVAGIDASQDMVRMAARRNRHAIAAQRVELRCGDSAHLPYADGRFDKIYAVHTIYFWPEPMNHLREICRVLKPGCRFVLGFRPAEDGGAADFPSSVYRFHTRDEVADLLARAGFRVVGPHRQPSTPVAFAVAERAAM